MHPFFGHDQHSYGGKETIQNELSYFDSRQNLVCEHAWFGWKEGLHFRYLLNPAVVEKVVRFGGFKGLREAHHHCYHHRQIPFCHGRLISIAVLRPQTPLGVLQRNS